MSLYVPLSTEWADHSKLIRAGLAGRGLHALTLAIAKRLETDGWVDRLLLHREGADDALIDRLVDLRLFDVDDAHPEAVRPHNWHRHNPTQAAIEAGRAAKAEAGKRGNHRRHKHAGPFDDCTICHPDRQVVAGCEPVRDGCDRIGSPESETETESKTTTTDSSSGIDSAPADPERPVVVDQPTTLRAIRLVADVQAASGRDPSALASTIRYRMGTHPNDPDRQRIDAELAAGRTPEAIAAAWSTPTGYPVVDVAAPERPRLAEVKASTEPLPPKAVGLAGSAAARAALGRRTTEAVS